MTNSSNKRPRGPKAKQQDLPLSWDDHGREESAAAPPEGEEDARGALPEETDEPEAPVAAVESLPDEPDERERLAAEELEADDGEGVSEEEAHARVVRLAESGPELGQALMEARGARNLTVAEVCQRTRIAREFIEALEADDLDQLPAAVYTRSYIRQLCSDYGIEAEPLVDAYDAMVDGQFPTPGRARFVLASEDDDVSARVQYTLRSAGEEGEGEGRRRPTAWLVGVTAALVVLVTAVAWGVWFVRGRAAAARQSVTSEAPAQPAVDLGEFIVPQQLPLKELPLPSSQPD